MNRVLNVPVWQIQRYSRSKKELELLAASVIIKRTFTNSLIYNLTETKLRKVLGVGKAKAGKMLAALKESDLFVYDKKHNSLLAKSLKSPDVKMYGRKDKRYRAKADYCKKIYETENKLSLVVRLLRETLLANMIDAPLKESLTRGKSIHSDVTSTGDPIPLRKLAKVINMSRSSACRYIGRMEEDGRVSKSQIVAEVVLPDYTPEKADEWMGANPGKRLWVRYSCFTHSFEGWLNKGRKYAVLDRKLSDSITNVIYNYGGKNRINRNGCRRVADPLAHHDNFYSNRVF